MVIDRCLVFVAALGVTVCGYWSSVIDAAAQPPTVSPAASRQVDFDREVRPILSENCFSCHGPDERARQDGFRLDVREGALADRGRYGGPAIVPGSAAESLLFHRISAKDSRTRMPRGGEALSEDEIETIRLWIDQGAEWKLHWAFVSPERPTPPQVAAAEWPRNPIDRFVLARLERDGLAPSAEADRATLLRRVTLDLTGLPPSASDVADFLNDDAPDAYEKAVDRLLGSSRYGERMAVEWLDAARYADTNGYQTDGGRTMWRWRDWVIDAYNGNMPFDQFTIEQIAGDMLPDATLDQKIATGFNRNHSGNGEGGIVPEEFLVEYAIDRVETTSTVWLGLTLGCARCHDHKFDPITQTEFYEVFANFNNVPERGKAFKYVNSPPFVTAPTTAQQAELDEFDAELAKAREAFAALESDRALRSAHGSSRFARLRQSTGVSATNCFHTSRSTGISRAFMSVSRFPPRSRTAPRSSSADASAPQPASMVSDSSSAVSLRTSDTRTRSRLLPGSRRRRPMGSSCRARAQETRAREDGASISKTARSD